jgi:pentatricopeptide repeat protein
VCRCWAARSKQWRVERIQTRERQRHAGQGRARFERTREQCSKAEASDAEPLRQDRRCGRIEDAIKVFDEMLAAGEVMPTAEMYNASIGGR